MWGDDEIHRGPSPMAADQAASARSEAALAVLESSPDGIALYDLNQQVVFANSRFCALWKLDGAALFGMDRDALHAHKRAMLSDPEQDGPLLLLTPDQSLSDEIRPIRLNNGQWYERLMFVHQVQGACQGHVVQWRDVTSRHNALVMLQTERDLLHSMMDSVPHQIYFKDTESRFTRVNKALAARYGLSNTQDVIGKSDADFYAADHAARTRREEQEIMATLTPQLNQMHHEVWSDGSDAWNVSTKMPLLDAQGKVIGLYGIAHDVTEQKRAEAVFWRQANFDALTNLPNRRLMRDRWEQLAHTGKRSGQPVALLLIDLDRFKEVNDTLGHAMGDELLVQAARRMSSCLRASDTLARLGGDEFAVLIGDLGGAPDVAVIAHKLLQCLSTPFDLGGHAVHIAGSLGISLCPADGEELDGLLRKADRAMYQAKSQGGNRYAFFAAA